MRYLTLDGAKHRSVCGELCWGLGSGWHLGACWSLAALTTGCRKGGDEQAEAKRSGNSDTVVHIVTARATDHRLRDRSAGHSWTPLSKPRSFPRCPASSSISMWTSAKR